MLRVLRYVLWDRRHRQPTRLCCQDLYLSALQNWQRTKPIRPAGHLPLTQMHPCPSWRKWPNSTLVQPCGHRQGQRQCNGYELQRRIHMLCCLHSLGFPGPDHTPDGWDQCTHGTSWWSCTSSTTWPSCRRPRTFGTTSRRLSRHTLPPRDRCVWFSRSCSPILARHCFLGQFDLQPPRSPFLLSWRPLSRPAPWRPTSFSTFDISLQISLVNSLPLRSTGTSIDYSTTAIQWA